jgi:nucleoside permease NupC
MVSSKWIWLGAGGLALAIGVPYVINLNRLSVELETVTKISIYKVKLDGVELKIDVMLKNPTKGSIAIKYPFVKMMSEGKVFATSELRDQDITLKEFSQTVLSPIFVNLSWINLATTLPSLLKKMRSNEPVTIQAKTITTINGSIPYSKEESIVLGNDA